MRKLVAVWLVPYVAIVAYFIFTGEDTLRRMPNWIWSVPLLYFVGGIALLSLVVSRGRFSADEQQHAKTVLQRYKLTWRTIMVSYAVAFAFGIVMLSEGRVPLLYGSVALAVIVVLFLFAWRIHTCAKAMESNRS